MELALIVTKAKRDCVIAWCTMTAVSAMAAKNGFAIGKRFGDRAADVSHFVLRRFAVLVAHGKCKSRDAHRADRIEHRRLLIESHEFREAQRTGKASGTHAFARATQP
ncbi:MAG: hypothetical protein O3A00_26435 [Planctomycetota bacterium]|nr:hypothetical protein [Planctomycetota bacterium]